MSFNQRLNIHWRPLVYATFGTAIIAAISIVFLHGSMLIIIGYGIGSTAVHEFAHAATARLLRCNVAVIRIGGAPLLAEWTRHDGFRVQFGFWGEPSGHIELKEAETRPYAAVLIFAAGPTVELGFGILCIAATYVAVDVGLSIWVGALVALSFLWNALPHHSSKHYEAGEHVPLANDGRLVLDAIRRTRRASNSESSIDYRTIWNSVAPKAKEHDEQTG